MYLGDRGNGEVNGDVLNAAELMRELTGMSSGGSSDGGGGKPLEEGGLGTSPSPCSDVYHDPSPDADADPGPSPCSLAVGLELGLGSGKENEFNANEELYPTLLLTDTRFFSKKRGEMLRGWGWEWDLYGSVLL